jgi:NADH-quinone oxidoreductase subunit L
MTGLLLAAAPAGGFDTTSWVILFAPLAAAVITAVVPAVRRHGGIAAALSIGAIALGLGLTLWKYFLPSLQGTFHGSEAIVPWMDVPGVAGFPMEFGARMDPLAVTMTLVVTAVGLAIHVYSLGYMAGDPSIGRFFGKLSLFVFSMLGIVVSPNFVQTFVFWELVGVSSYLLIGYYWEKDSAGEAAKKAFLTNRVGDFGFLLGILLVWGVAGSFDFAVLEGKIRAGGLEVTAALGGVAAIAGALVFTGAMGKSAQFPLHVWLPDAMEGPTPVSALMHAATMVAAGVYMIVRTFFLFEGTTWAPTLVAWIGGITAFLAASIAITQNDIKKILAYSTLSQLGYMTLALGAGAYSASMFHLTTHAFFKALLFLGAGSVIHACHTQDIFEMGGLRRPMRQTHATFLVGTLALCGIFPFAGFWSKDEILSSVLHAEALPGHLLLYALGTVVAGMTSFYMGRCLVVTFYGPYRGHGHPHESPPVMTGPLWFLAFFSVTIGFVGVPGGLFGLENRFEGFLHHWHVGAPSEFHWPVALVSTAFAVGGLLLAVAVYGRAVPGTDPLPARLGRLHALWRNLYYVDDFYLFLVRRVQQGIARLSWVVERRVVIGGMVNGTAQAARAAGERLRRVENGRLTSYVTWLLLGTVAIAAAVLLGWRA